MHARTSTTNPVLQHSVIQKKQAPDKTWKRLAQMSTETLFRHDLEHSQLLDTGAQEAMR